MTTAAQSIVLQAHELLQDPDIFMLEQSAFESSIATKSVDAWRGLTKNTPRSRVNFC